MKETEKKNNFNITIPKNNLEEFLKIIENLNQKEKIFISQNNNQILFYIPDEIWFQSSLIQGEYPDFSLSIPKKFNDYIIFKKDDLIETIERVAILSTKDIEMHHFNIIKLEIFPQKIFFSSKKEEIGQVKEEISFEEKKNEQKDKKEKIIFLNARYFLEALKNIQSKKVILKIIDNKSPFIIQGEEEIDLIHLLLSISS